MPLKIYDWNKHFFYKEANDAKHVFWRKHPVTHNSVRFRRLMRDSNGRTAYVVFMVVVDLCARARSAGVLMDGQTPIDAETVNLATGIPLHTCKLAFQLLTAPEIGWLIDSESIENRATIDSESNTEQSRAEQELEIEKSKAEPSSATESSASQSRPAPPSSPGQPYTVDFVMQCLTSQGIGVADAYAMIADAAVLAPSDGLARLVKGSARLSNKRKKLAKVGQEVDNPVNYVMVAGELKKSAKTVVAERRSELSRLRLAEGGAA
jgi:hypothetical protein